METSELKLVEGMSVTPTDLDANIDDTAPIEEAEVIE